MKHVAILNDGSYSGNAPLLDWTRIPVSDEEVETVTLEELVDRRHDAFVNDEGVTEDDWEECFGAENEEVRRAFILDGDLIEKVLESTLNAHIGGDRLFIGDDEAYAVASALIAIMEVLAVRVVDLNP